MSERARRKNPSKSLFKTYLIPVSLYAVFVFTTGCVRSEDEMGKSTRKLPERVGVWTKPDAPRIVTSDNIFAYMNGAGELYVGYRFDRLEVYEYEADGRESILAELYFMETSDDAFGLISLDWGGENIDLGGAVSEIDEEDEELPWPKALYGEGLLRMWSGTVYARIMAARETPESREAVISLGYAVMDVRKPPVEPELLKVVPEIVDSDWRRRGDRTGYFRSYLVLNSLYFLSQENILDLGLETEGMTAPYIKTGSDGPVAVRLLVVKYRDAGSAASALAHFHRVYLPEHEPLPPTDPPSGHTGLFFLEDGWLGYKLSGDKLAIVFECPDRETAAKFVQSI